MQAIRILGPGQVTLQEIPDPPPGPGEVVVRVRVTGLCGTDVEIADGTMPYFTTGMAQYPITPGHEWAGEVVAVTTGVTRFRPGDQVVGEYSLGCGQCDRCRSGAYHLCPQRQETGILGRDGGFAEYVTVELTRFRGQFRLWDEESQIGSPGVWPDVIRLLEEGHVRLAPLISHRLPLAAFAAGLDLLKQQTPGVVRWCLSRKQRRAVDGAAGDAGPPHGRQRCAALASVGLALQSVSAPTRECTYEEVSGRKKRTHRMSRWPGKESFTCTHAANEEVGHRWTMNQTEA